MFKSLPMGLMVLSVVSDKAKASKSTFRPIDGTVPWHKDVSSSSWQDPTWKVNYPVPNFGQDSEIQASLAHTEAAEKRLKHKMQASFKTPKGHPKDYFVPNFGVDHDIRTSLANTEEAEGTLSHVMQASFKEPKGHPKDYFVPNFGVDKDIADTHSNLQQTEDKLNHKYSVSSFKQPKGHPKDYFVPNFGLDHDIVDAQNNIAAQEKIHGKWSVQQDDNGVWQVPTAADNNSYTYANVQLDSDIKIESDPICSSAGCVAKKAKSHPKDYFVPNFGVDQDIIDSQSNLHNTEKKLNHVLTSNQKKPSDPPRNYFVPNFGVDQDIKDAQANIASQEKLHGKWKVEQDDNGVWQVPTAADNNSYTYANVQLDSQVNTESDPICNSAGCTQYKHPNKDSYPKDYFVPNFGVDHDITHNFEDLAWAENKVGHKWNWNKPAKKDDAVVYGNAPLEGDIQTSLANLKSQEAIHGKWTLPPAEDELQIASDPACSSAGCTQYLHPKKKLGYDLDYEVPNFGQDKEIKDNFKSLDIAEKQENHKLELGTKESKEKYHNVAKDTEYDFKPSLDSDVITTQNNLKKTEGRLNHKYELLQTESDPVCNSYGCTQYLHPHKKLGYDLDYEVPNLGQDKDIKDNFNSLDIAEKQYNHKLILGTKESREKYHNVAKDTDYDFNPSLDSDVITTQNNLKKTEGRLNHKYELLQTEAESDPICNSAGCTQYLHPHKKLGYDLDYFVPNLGKDKDIIDNFHSLEVAEKMKGRTWNFKLEDTPVNPAKKTLYDFNQKLDEDIVDSQTNTANTERLLNHVYEYTGVMLQMESDPICSSAGCWKSEFTKHMEDKIVQYPDPEAQGLEGDIKSTLAHEAAASDRLGHKWNPWDI